MNIEERHSVLDDKLRLIESIVNIIYGRNDVDFWTKLDIGDQIKQLSEQITA